MGIKLEVRALNPREHNKGYIAEVPNEPGTSIVGRGNTWLEAIGDYCVQTLTVEAKVFDKNGKPRNSNSFGPYYRKD